MNFLEYTLASTLGWMLGAALVKSVKFVTFHAVKFYKFTQEKEKQ